MLIVYQLVSLGLPHLHFATDILHRSFLKTRRYHQKSSISYPLLDPFGYRKDPFALFESCRNKVSARLGRDGETERGRVPSTAMAMYYT